MLKKQIIPILIIFLLSACGTRPMDTEVTESDNEKKIIELLGNIKELKYQVNDLEHDNRISKSIVIQLKNDIQSLNEQIVSNRKNIDIIKRGLRSGIFEDQSDINTKALENLAKMTMLPDISQGRDGFSEKKNESLIKLPTTPVAVETNLAPSQLLADAEIKIRQGMYGEAIVTLDEVKKSFPNFDDSGKKFLLSSEAWLKLGEHNNVFENLRTFYLKYPASPELAHAKLLEAETNEKLGSQTKASNLYQEVISLSPQSMYAQNARDGLLRMRDAK